jgi:hypothetical protein
MIRNYIEYLSEPEFRETSAKPMMTFLAAQLIVHALMVDHVVSVHAAGSGLKIWRAINVRHTQIL